MGLLLSRSPGALNFDDSSFGQSVVFNSYHEEQAMASVSWYPTLGAIFRPEKSTRRNIILNDVPHVERGRRTLFIAVTFRTVCANCVSVSRQRSFAADPGEILWSSLHSC